MSFQFFLGLIRQILLIPPFKMWRNWIAGSKSLTRVTLLAWEIVAHPAQDQMPELSKTCSNLIFAFSTNFLAYCTNFLNRGQQTTALVPILPTTCFVFFLTFWGGVFIYLFIYFWLCWVFVSVRGLSLVVASGGHSSSRCAGLSLSRPLLLAEHRLRTRRLSSCGSRA